LLLGIKLKKNWDRSFNHDGINGLGALLWTAYAYSTYDAISRLANYFLIGEKNSVGIIIDVVHVITFNRIVHLI